MQFWVRLWLVVLFFELRGQALANESWLDPDSLQVPRNLSQMADEPFHNEAQIQEWLDGLRAPFALYCDPNGGFTSRPALFAERIEKTQKKNPELFQRYLKIVDARPSPSLHEETPNLFASLAREAALNPSHPKALKARKLLGLIIRDRGFDEEANWFESAAGTYATREESLARLKHFLRRSDSPFYQEMMRWKLILDPKEAMWRFAISPPLFEKGCHYFVEAARDPLAGSRMAENSFADWGAWFIGFPPPEPNGPSLPYELLTYLSPQNVFLILIQAETLESQLGIHWQVSRNYVARHAERFFERRNDQQDWTSLGAIFHQTKIEETLAPYLDEIAKELTQALQSPADYPRLHSFWFNHLQTYHSLTSDRKPLQELGFKLSALIQRKLEARESLPPDLFQYYVLSQTFLRDIPDGKRIQKEIQDVIFEQLSGHRSASDTVGLFPLVGHGWTHLSIAQQPDWDALLFELFQETGEKPKEDRSVSKQVYRMTLLNQIFAQARGKKRELLSRTIWQTTQWVLKANGEQEPATDLMDAITDSANHIMLAEISYNLLFNESETELREELIHAMEISPHEALRKLARMVSLPRKMRRIINIKK